ncbi:fungal-specific transcription factor domain-containing protein [Kalaharituber pfeilii]|nr:fungal-specific transcription factor domain-containing protein [Kalaharituber pfeilii]
MTAVEAGRDANAVSSSFSTRTNLCQKGPSRSGPIASANNATSQPNGTAEQSTPPTDCFACKKRRIACDRGLPTCQKCAKKGIPCPGYQKPKIIWKVHKSVPETRRPPAAVAEVPQSLRATGPSVSTSRRTTTIRNRSKLPLRDIGYTFKIDISAPTPSDRSDLASTDQSSQGSKSKSLSPEANIDANVEVIPRTFDPYVGHIDYLSRSNIDYYHERICMCIEYFKPLRPTKTGLLAPSHDNPLVVVIAQAVESPLLLNCLLCVAARHRAITINTEHYVGVAREYDSLEVFMAALKYHSSALRLLQKWVSEQMELQNPTAGRIDEETETMVAGIGENKISLPKSKQMWEEDSMMMVMLLLVYYDAVDGGIGDGNWRNHLEVAKWVIEQREGHGLEMGAKGTNWGFVRDHIEIFDAFGATFTFAHRLASVHLWLQPRKGDHTVHDAAPLSPITPTGYSPNGTMKECTNAIDYAPRSLEDIVNAPEYIDTYPVLLLPRALLRIMHQIAALRREKAQLDQLHIKTSYDYFHVQGIAMSVGEIRSHHDYIYSCIRAFNPMIWPAPPYPGVITGEELHTISELHKLALHVYLHLSLTVPLSRIPIVPGVTQHPTTPLSPGESPLPPLYPTPPNQKIPLHPPSLRPSPPSSLPDTTSARILLTLSDQLIECLRRISPMSPAFRSAVWPCIVAGIAAQRIDQVVYLGYYMGNLIRGMPCMSVQRGGEALERLWRKRAKVARQMRRARGRQEFVYVTGVSPSGSVIDASGHEPQWDPLLEGYEGGVEDWEAVIEALEGEWLVI